jgi:hypothetical protein
MCFNFQRCWYGMDVSKKARIVQKRKRLIYLFIYNFVIKALILTFSLEILHPKISQGY